MCALHNGMSSIFNVVWSGLRLLNMSASHPQLDIRDAHYRTKAAGPLTDICKSGMIVRNEGANPPYFALRMPIHASALGKALSASVAVRGR